ncbi:hypothetical protein SLS58_005327 [Diplodia intermedia]|uniref:Uncharacterized protein n=1 Tax=Diplodia intermedia TaxID=856260 RepID=A0ABR3TRE8_9PEZI
MAAPAPLASHPPAAPAAAEASATASIDPATLARWGPRWTTRDVTAGIRQYSVENGWLEGTVWQWSQAPTDQQDVVFHTCLDTMAALLLRTKCMLEHLDPLSPPDSSAVAAEIKNVQHTMGLLMHQFTLIRPLETLVMAWNVGLGLEEHFELFVKFGDMVKERLTGPGLAEAAERLDALNKLFDETICVFKGPHEEREQRAAEIAAARAKWIAENQPAQQAAQ